MGRKVSVAPSAEADLCDIVTYIARRNPGAAIRMGGEDTGWYAITLQLQALLGAATVAMGMALGRRWLSRGATLAAGLLMAVWPHNIAATGAVLSEVLFGFLLVLALWLAVESMRYRTKIRAAAPGLIFGAAALVNPVVLLFPPLAALMFARSGRRRQAVLLVLLPLAIAGAWGLRNLSLPPTPGEATILMPPV